MSANGLYVAYDIATPDPEDESILAQVLRIIAELPTHDPTRRDLTAFLLWRASVFEVNEATRLRGLRARQRR